MSPASYAIGFTYIGGAIGAIALIRFHLLRPAHETTDHPSIGARIFFRVMAILMCQFLSFVLTKALIGALPAEGLTQWVKHGPEISKAFFILAAPIPLTLVLYFLHSKLVRWLTKLKGPPR